MSSNVTDLGAMTSVQQIMVAKLVGTLVMAPKSVTFRRHDHLVSVLFGDLLSHSYNITFSMFLDLVISGSAAILNLWHPVHTTNHLRLYSMEIIGFEGCPQSSYSTRRLCLVLLDLLGLPPPKNSCEVLAVVQ